MACFTDQSSAADRTVMDPVRPRQKPGVHAAGHHPRLGDAVEPLLHLKGGRRETAIESDDHDASAGHVALRGDDLVEAGVIDRQRFLYEYCLAEPQGLCRE